MNNELVLKEDYKKQQEILYQANNDKDNSVDQLQNPYLTKNIRNFLVRKINKLTLHNLHFEWVPQVYYLILVED
jgi:hypothetical protein